MLDRLDIKLVPDRVLYSAADDELFLDDSPFEPYVSKMRVGDYVPERVFRAFVPVHPTRALADIFQQLHSSTRQKLWVTGDIIEALGETFWEGGIAIAAEIGSALEGELWVRTGSLRAAYEDGASAMPWRRREPRCFDGRWTLCDMIELARAHDRGFDARAAHQIRVIRNQLHMLDFPRHDTLKILRAAGFAGQTTSTRTVWHDLVNLSAYLT